MRALLVYPTHENCREVKHEYFEAGIEATTYPARRTVPTKHEPANCWNAEADIAEKMGFSVVKTICPSCTARQRCNLEGYLKQLADAKAATVALCTHKRVELTGFADIAANRSYVSIHENPVNLLRPKMEICEAGLWQVQRVVIRMLSDPQFLDWFGNDLRVDEAGRRYHDEELAVRKHRQYVFIRALDRLISNLLHEMQTAEKTVAWSPSDCCRLPVGTERTLYRATRDTKAQFVGQPWRFVLAAATGELRSAALVVARRSAHVNQTAEDLKKSAIGFRNNCPPSTCVTWFNDATISADRLQTILGAPVSDCTPDGRLPLQKKAVQILRDVTRRTSVRIVAGLIRGVLADRPQFRRIGLICHRPHLKAVGEFGTEFASRIAKTTHFGSGEDRSSNSWHNECDLLLICGTPRMPPHALAAYLVQVGEVAAACRGAEWGTIRWEARTESDEPITVTAKGYLDAAWRQAQHDLVRAALVQAIGRGRGILKTGCEVIVLSTEECGLPISDAHLETLNSASDRVLERLNLLAMENVKSISLEKSIVKTAQIAHASCLSVVRVRELLRELEQRGLVRKIGERGGWLPVAWNSTRSMDSYRDVRDAEPTDSGVPSGSDEQVDLVV